MGLATIMNWASNLLVTLSFLSLIRTMGCSDTFWLFGAIGIGTWAFIYYLSFAPRKYPKFPQCDVGKKPPKPA